MPVLSRQKVIHLCWQFKRSGKKIVFTNGCFDILHIGHLKYLQFAKELGDLMIVGLNSDDSVRRNKGDSRPINNQNDRAELLCALKPVDYVVIFDEDEPRQLISEIIPDILVKGKDWSHYVSGREIVESHGGRVVFADLIPDKSTSNILKKIYLENNISMSQFQKSKPRPIE